MQIGLHPVLGAEGHVVAQIIEAELVVGPVDHVGPVGGLLLLGRHVRHHHSGGHADIRVDMAHPLGVAPSQVIVDRDNMNAAPGQGIEIRRQRRHQGLALAGAHLGDMAFVQGDGADELNVEVAHLQSPPAGLADQGEGLGDQRLQGLTAGVPAAELFGLGLERFLGEGLGLGLQRVDPLDDPAHAPDLPVVAGADYLP